MANPGDAAVVKVDARLRCHLHRHRRSGEFFVSWRKSGDSWKLANGYVVRVGPLREGAPKSAGKE